MYVMRPENGTDELVQADQFEFQGARLAPGQTDGFEYVAANGVLLDDLQPGDRV
jgi:hypothetical protein